VLAAGAAVVFAGGVVGVVAVHPAPPERPIAAAVVPDPTTTVAGLPAETTVAPSSTAPPGSVPTTGPNAPAAGRYTYSRSSGSSKPVTATSTTKTTATTRPPRPTTTRRGRTTTSQSTTTVKAQLTPSGQETRTVTVSRGGHQGDAEIGQMTVVLLTGAGEVSGTAAVAWGLGGLVVRDATYRLFGGTFVCDWQPDWAQFAPSLFPGATWASSATCSGTVRGGQLDGRPVQMSRKDSHRSAGQQVEQVAGRSITSFSITGATDFEMDAGEVGFTSHTDGTERFSPELGLSVGSTLTTTVTSFGATKTTTTTEQLVGLP
jgi:hypothetical protein